MVIIKDDSYLIKTRVNVGSFFGREAEEGFIDIREPDGKDLMRVKSAFGNGEAAMMDAFLEILPRIIVEHNLYKDEATLHTNAEVAAIVNNKAAICIEVFGRFAEQMVFTLAQPSAEKSAGSPGASSEGS